MAYTMWRPSGEIATWVALPFSVSLVICMFCRLKPRGWVSSLYPPNPIAARTTATAAAIASLGRPFFSGVTRRGRGTDFEDAEPAGSADAALGADSWMAWARPEVVSRLRRLRSALISAALW